VLRWNHHNLEEKWTWTSPWRSWTWILIMTSSLEVADQGILEHNIVWWRWLWMNGRRGVCVCVCVCVRIHVWICIHCAAKGVECSCYDWPRPKLDQQNSFFWESRTLNQGNIKFGSFDSDSLQWSRQKIPELLCYNQSLNPPWYPALLEAGKVHLFLESPKVSNPVFVLPASIFLFLKQTGVCLQNNHG